MRFYFLGDIYRYPTESESLLPGGYRYPTGSEGIDTMVQVRKVKNTPPVTDWTNLKRKGSSS